MMQSARRLALTLATSLAAAACAGAPSPPNEQPGVERTSQAVRPELLGEAIDYARTQNTTGLLIIQDGQTLFEANWPLPDDAQEFRTAFVHGVSKDGALLEDVASLQKSFVAILAGSAVDRGLLDVDKPVSAYISEGWSKATREQEGAITVRHLLEMRSGLTEALTFEAPAGSKFFYNTPAYAMMKPVLSKASGSSLETITREWLTAPLGLSDTSWRQRPSYFNGVGNPTGLVTTPRDISRLGQMVLDGGRSPSGVQIISKAQLEATLARSPTNPSYGRLWWLNGGDFMIDSGPGGPVKGYLIPEAPRDLIAGQGAEGRKLYVVPSLRLIVVRTGKQPPDRNFNSALWSRLSKALPSPQAPG